MKKGLLFVKRDDEESRSVEEILQNSNIEVEKHIIECDVENFSIVLPRLYVHNMRCDGLEGVKIFIKEYLPNLKTPV